MINLLFYFIVFLISSNQKKSGLKRKEEITVDFFRKEDKGRINSESRR